MKQILMTKEKLFNEKQRLLIEKKIKELKQQFRKYSSNRVEEMYKILCEIVKLRQSTTKSRGRYTSRSLEWEKGLKLNAPQIRYIFSYEHFSDKSKKLVEEEKVNDSSICCLIWRFSILRNPQVQNAVVKAYLDGKIKISDLTEMNTQDIISFMHTGKVNLSDTERHIISAIKTVRSTHSRLKSYKIHNMKTKYKEKLLNSLKRFEDYLKEM